MDSAILGSSAMFTHNIYHGLFRLKVGQRKGMQQLDGQPGI